MATISCPSCDKRVDIQEKKCPSCGAKLRYSLLDKDAPSYQKMQIISNGVIAVGAVLLVLELLNINVGYISGMVLGVAFILFGISRLMLERLPSYEGAKTATIVIILAIVFLAYGIFMFVKNMNIAA